MLFHKLSTFNQIFGDESIGAEIDHIFLDINSSNILQFGEISELSKSQSSHFHEYVIFDLFLQILKSTFASELSNRILLIQHCSYSTVS